MKARCPNCGCTGLAPVCGGMLVCRDCTFFDYFRQPMLPFSVADARLAAQWFDVIDREANGDELGVTA